MWESRVLRRAFERLELHEGKLSRAVLRGGGGGNVTSLPDLKGAYGEKPRLQQLVEAQLQGGIEGQSSISMQQKVGKQRVQFLGEGGTRIVGVGADQLSVHMLRPYTGWESFRPQIHQALDAYRSIAEPEGITRIGLRYINKISIKAPHDDLTPYFTIPPKFPEIDSTTRLLAFFNRKEAAVSDRPIRIVVTFADMESAPSPSYLLDLDIIWISPECLSRSLRFRTCWKI